MIEICDNIKMKDSKIKQQATRKWVFGFSQWLIMKLHCPEM